MKTRRVDGQGHGGPAHLRREQAGLRTAEPAGVTPRLIGSDDGAGVVVTADLGRWPTVEAVLAGGDADTAAWDALMAAGLPVGQWGGRTSRPATAGAGGRNSRVRSL